MEEIIARVGGGGSLQPTSAPFSRDATCRYMLLKNRWSASICTCQMPMNVWIYFLSHRKIIFTLIEDAIISPPFTSSHENKAYWAAWLQPAPSVVVTFSSDASMMARPRPRPAHHPFPSTADVMWVI